MNFEINIYNKFDNQLANIWKNFEKISFHHIFQKYDWVECWQKEIGEKKYGFSPQIFEIKENNETVFLLPLGLRKYLNIIILECLGGIQSDYHSPLISKKISKNKTKQKAIFDFILDNLPKHDILILSNQPKFISLAENHIFKIGKINAIDSYSLQMNEIDYDIFLKDILSKKIKNDTNRQKKRLSELGILKFHVVESQKEAEYYFNLLVEHKSKKYKETSAFNIFSDKHFYNFYNNIVNVKKYGYFSQFSILTLNKEVIALHMGFYSDDIFYYILPSYNSNYFKYSPGRILLDYLVEWSFKKKIRVFDFCLGAEKYKSDWTNDTMKISES